jgi:myo-inositol-1(or 4)-monophosphatase
MSQLFINQDCYVNYSEQDQQQEQELADELEFINQIVDLIEDELNDQLNRPLQVFNKITETTLDYVTEADHRIEEIIIEQINNRFPDDQIIGEEQYAREPSKSQDSGNNNSQRRWFIDPIDGTMNFVRNIPGWCVSIACQDANGLRLAVIADLMNHEIFTAARGNGAFLNNIKIDAVQPSSVFNETIYGGFIEQGKTEFTRARRSKINNQLTCMNRSLGSAALSLAYTAAGRFDSTYFECPIYDWDIAAGLLICSETGCQGQLFSPAKDGQYPRLLVSKEPLFSEFKNLIQ